MNLIEVITQHEQTIRLSFFLGVLAVMALWEILAPKRALTVSKALRWGNNLGLVFFNSFLLRLIFPAAAVGMAAFASEQGWGLFNYVQLPLAVTIVLSVVIMDLIIYLQHVMVHAVPALWRLHRVHHADLDFDVTTGIRNFRTTRQSSWITGLLLMPFVGKVSGYAINRREWSQNSDDNNSEGNQS